MSIFTTYDPKVVPIGVRLRAILPDIEELAGVEKKNSAYFRELMIDLVDNAHRMVGNNPKLLAGASKARRLIDELEQVLNANPNLSRRLGWRLEHLDTLSERLHRFEQLERHGQPNKWLKTIKQRFVYGLLDAAHRAGGDLGLDRRSGRGNLVEAIDQLRPCLPDELRHGLSPSTLRNIKTAWLKNRKK